MRKGKTVWKKLQVFFLIVLMLFSMPATIYADDEKETEPTEETGDIKGAEPEEAEDGKQTEPEEAGSQSESSAAPNAESSSNAQPEEDSSDSVTAEDTESSGGQLISEAPGTEEPGTEEKPSKYIYGFGSQAACDYVLKGTIPVFLRDLPIASDDPYLQDYDDHDMIPYEYGYVFGDVNDYYIYDPETDDFVGREPVMDTGVLIGGNAYSKHDAMELDIDDDDFNSILPYGNIYIDPKKMSYRTGRIEYEFFTDVFNYNNTENVVPDNITIVNEDHVLTSYAQKFPAAANQRRTRTRTVDWSGIIYTGGISKTMTTPSGYSTMTVVENKSRDEDRLFTVRYKDAAINAQGETYDLVLTFKKITFVAEARVTGALSILEADRLYVSPVLVSDGEYVITMKDESNQAGVNDQDGVRIGVKYEFDYSVETAEGEEAKGLILFSVSDLDNASMAPALQTNADWGLNELENDFRWAEGFGVVNGAASFAVLPYYNHDMTDVDDRKINNYNGDEELIRISRMAGTSPDGTANGLYFTTSITAVSGRGTRNDADTLDTGLSMLLYPRGSFVSTISAGRRGDVKISLFDAKASNKIEQSGTEGGRVYSMDYAFNEQGELTEYTDFLKVVGGGTNSVHYIEADRGYRISALRIDGQEMYLNDMIWDELPDGSARALLLIQDEYGRSYGKTEYIIEQDVNGSLRIAFENIQDDHEIHVLFVKLGLFESMLLIDGRAVTAVFLIAGFAVLLIISMISWMIKKKKGTIYLSPNDERK